MSDDGLIASILECNSKNFVASTVVTIGKSGVEEIDAAVEGFLHGRDGICVRNPDRRDSRHGPAAQPNSAYLQIGIA